MLKGANRDFYICVTPGRRDWRTALYIFDFRVGAEILRELGDGSREVDTQRAELGSKLTHPLGSRHERTRIGLDSDWTVSDSYWNKY